MSKRCIYCRRTESEGAVFEEDEGTYDGLKQMCGTKGIIKNRKVEEEGEGCRWKTQLRKEKVNPNKRKKSERRVDDIGLECWTREDYVNLLKEALSGD